MPQQLAGEKQKALSDARRAIELDPQYAKAHFRLGQALRANGDAVAAVQAMERVLQLEPKDAAATVALTELSAALRARGSNDPGACSSAPKLSGAFASGTVVPDAAHAAKAAAETFSARAPPALSESMKSAHPDTADGKMLIGKADFHKVESAAAGFLDKADQAKIAHAALQPPPKPKTRAELEYPGITFPPGFGPDAPDWDPSFTPVAERTLAAAAAALGNVNLS